MLKKCHKSLKNVFNPKEITEIPKKSHKFQKNPINPNKSHKSQTNHINPK